MSCDLLEHAKQGYKEENKSVSLEPQLSHEAVVVPKTVPNSSLEQVYSTYTNVNLKKKILVFWIK